MHVPECNRKLVSGSPGTTTGWPACKSTLVREFHCPTTHGNRQISHRNAIQCAGTLPAPYTLPDRHNPTPPYMTKLTIGRMAKLYGLHRSTLHEAVAKGRVTAGHDGKGQRVIDLSEMIRVYGEPVGRPTPPPDTQTPAEDNHPTPPDTPAGWAELVNELRLLREEVAGLRQELRLIEHKPAAPTAPGTSEVAETAPPAPQPDAPAASNQASVTGRSGQSAHAPAARTFGDLLSSWEA